MEENKEQFLELVYGDTDSVVSSTQIEVLKNGAHNKLCIEEFFNKMLKTTQKIEKTIYGHEMIDGNGWLITNFRDNVVTNSPIKRLIRHKVNKDIYRIKTSDGKYIECTGDHSIMVMRNNNIISVKPMDIKKTDKLIVYG